MPNRLSRERSPYLLQHANNPVDWYPWGQDAFDEARRSEKPIFLSIGYSTCHWCHVMEHESFEDASVAAILNRDFVSIKVDREERPDVDRVYMTFVQATTGAGGWPMSVWLTPDLKPFFGGTYFPPASKWGKPGFVDVLAEIGRAWRDERPRLLTSADTILDRLRQATAGEDAAPDRAPVASVDAIAAGIASFAEAFDARRGGFGGAPKFPRPSELLFLLQGGALVGDMRARQMALDTLRAMALGGIRDHVGGGFHRYSVDAEWRVPHFEKMLYDQSQLVLAYLEGAQASGDAFYAAVAEDTLGYVLRDMTAPDGAFYSAEDADSLPPGAVAVEAQMERRALARHDTAEKREGAFYVWTSGEIDRLMGADASIVAKRFGVEKGGNALSDPQDEFRDQNILYVAQSIDEVATRTSTSSDEVMAALARARTILFTERGSRPRPHLDDKVITAWNGLMIAAFARAARVLVDSPRQADWLSAARRAADAIHARLWNASSQTLLRRFRDEEAAIDGFSEDYACLAWGALELFQATGEGRWLEWARALTIAQVSRFHDARDGGWFSTTGGDPSILLRLKEDYDGAEPSSASVTVHNLIVLGHLLGDQALTNLAGRTFERYGPEIGRVVRVMPFMVANLVRWHGGGAQVVLVGEPGSADTVALAAVMARRYVPWAVTIPLPPGEHDVALAAAAPWLNGMRTVSGRAAAYVCHDFTCQAPITDPAALDAALAELAQPRRVVSGRGVILSS